MTDEHLFVKNKYIILNKNVNSNIFQVSILFVDEKSCQININISNNVFECDELYIVIFDHSLPYIFDIVKINLQTEHTKIHNRQYIRTPFEQTDDFTSEPPFDFPYPWIDCLENIYPYWNEYISLHASVPDHSFYIPRESSRYCVFRLPDKNILAKQIIKNIMRYLDGWGLIIIHKKSNKDFLNSQFETMRNSYITYIEQNTDTLVTTNIQFYMMLKEMMNADTILLVDSYSLMMPDVSIQKYTTKEFVGTKCDTSYANGNDIFCSKRFIHMTSDVAFISVEKCIHYMKKYPFDKLSIQEKYYLPYIFTESSNTCYIEDNVFQSVFDKESCEKIKNALEVLRQKYQ